MSEKFNVPENHSLESFEGAPEQAAKVVEKSVLPNLNELMKSIYFERDAGAGVIKQWGYRIPSLENTILDLALDDKMGDKSGFFIQGTFWEKDGNTLFDTNGIRILDSNGIAVGVWDGSHFFVEAEKISDGFFVEKDGEKHSLIVEF